MITEKAPPGAKAESWITSNKERFHKQYGAKKGEQILYATAWKLFGESELPLERDQIHTDTSPKALRADLNKKITDRTRWMRRGIKEEGEGGAPPANSVGDGSGVQNFDPLLGGGTGKPKNKKRQQLLRRLMAQLSGKTKY